jgi:hypothetical protein
MAAGAEFFVTSLAVEILDAVSPALRRTQCGASVADESVNGGVRVIMEATIGVRTGIATSLDSFSAPAVALELRVRYCDGRVDGRMSRDCGSAARAVVRAAGAERLAVVASGAGGRCGAERGRQLEKFDKQNGHPQKM